MANHVFTTANSFFGPGETAMPQTFDIVISSAFNDTSHAFFDDGQFDAHSLFIPVDGFAITTAISFNALELTVGDWTILVNGSATATGGFTGTGLHLADATQTLLSKVTVGVDGDIYGGEFGIHAAHRTNIVNSGTIVGVEGTGVYMDTSGDFAINNSKSGSIIGSAASGSGGVFGGIRISGDGTHTITNAGRIESALALLATATNGVEKVTNSGSIFGFVDLGGGDDSFTNFAKVKVKHKVVVIDGFVTGVINLGEGNDKFTGGNSGETVRGFTGDDIIKFGGGNDTYQTEFGTSDGNDTVDGGKGVDTFDARGADTTLFINLDTVSHTLSPINNDAFTPGGIAKEATTGVFSIGTDRISNFENVKGGSAADVLYGNAGANKLEGGGGGDNHFGYGGNDTIVGGAGNDAIAGGTGKDTLWGGNEFGSGDGVLDWFQFFKTSDSGVTRATRDVIMDFQQGTDVIDLHFMDAISNNANGTNDAFTLLAGPGFLFPGFTGVAGQLLYTWNGASTIISGDVNGDRKADFSIELRGIHTLSTDDFDF